MSKEAIGQNGAVIGSSEYWQRTNQSTFLGNAVSNISESDYKSMLREVGHRASSALDEIYDDLQTHMKSIRAIPDSRRNALAREVRGLYEVCMLAGTSSGRSGDCISILNLSGFYVGSRYFANESAIQSAIKKIKNNSDFFTSECLSILQQAADWGIGFAAGSDHRKKSFLEDVAQGRGKDFLQQVLDAFRNESGSADMRGNNGCEIGSNDYIQRIEHEVFRQDISMMHSARFGTPNYAELLKESLEKIAHTLERDLDRSGRENDYLTDAMAAAVKRAGKSLESCGISISVDSRVNKLAWFVGGNASKIRQLQKGLNTLGCGEHLTEDGVYGKKTLQAWSKFLQDLEHGTVPTLCWIDVLQSNKTGITIGSTRNGAEAGLNNAFIYNKHPYIRFDPPHNGRTGWFRGVKRPIDYNHVNFDKMPDSNWLYNQIQSRYNHYPLSDDAYNALKDLKSTGKKVRIAGKVLLVAGVALDVLELGTAIQEDLNDVDGKLGRTTVSTVASIGGSWAGGALGAKAGALLGALAGPAAPVAIPVLSIAGGIGGAFGGDKFAQWVIDITEAED